MSVSAGCLPKWKGDSIGPYLYVQVGSSVYLHLGVRYFRSDWQRGLGAWFTLRAFWRCGS